MKHDNRCELWGKCDTCSQIVATPHCHCGSRAFALCKGCQRGLHLNHATTEPSTGEICACDLCDEGTAA